MQKGQTADQLEFGTVNTQDNPVLHKDTNSASVCINFRPLPGGWLRSWGGRVARKFNEATGLYLQFHEYHNARFAGFPLHLEQYKRADLSVVWRSLALDNFHEEDVEEISLAHDPTFVARNSPVAVSNVLSRVVYYQGLGVRDPTNSRPPFSQWDGLIVQYFGLDCFCPSNVAPSVAGGGGAIDLSDGPVKVYVGWHNTDTLHFGNGKLMGVIASGTGLSINVSGLNRLSMAAHAGAEPLMLKYVFYATLPGLSVPYLLMKPDGITPLTADSDATTFAITDLRHDVTKEMPTTNYPPKPMRWLANVGGRLYGALLDTSLGGAYTFPVDDFNYQTGNPRDMCGVMYSAAVNDLKGRSYLGNPEESWPIGSGYFTPSPNGMIPLWGMASPDESALIVFTAIATYVVAEAADRVHTWEPLSNIHGIRQGNTAVSTDKGIIWLTQRNQIVIYGGTSLRNADGIGQGSVKIISGPYEHLLYGKRPTGATYTLDPVNHIDRYEVYFDDGTGVVHDFEAGGGYQITGQFQCGRTLVDQANRSYFIIANSSIYTQAGQPGNIEEVGTGHERIADQWFDPSGAVNTQVFTSTWGSQWLNYNKPVTRKEIIRLALYADGAGLRDNPFLDVQMYADTAGLSQINRTTSIGRLNLESGGPSGDVPKDEKTGLALYEFKFSRANYFKFKWLIIMTGRSDVVWHPGFDEYGNMIDHHSNLAGAVFSLHHELQEAGDG